MTTIFFLIETKKQKTFSQFLGAYPRSTLNFEDFEKEDDPHRRCISEITEAEKGD